MSVKVILMLRRKQGMSREAFRVEYEGGHSRLGLRLFGHLWTEYRRNYLGTASRFTAEAGTPTAADAGEAEGPYDVITELVLEDMAALEEMNRIASLPENRRLLSEDEERLFDRENCWTSMCEVLEEDLGLEQPPSPLQRLQHERDIERLVDDYAWWLGQRQSRR